MTVYYGNWLVICGLVLVCISCEKLEHEQIDFESTCVRLSIQNTLCVHAHRVQAYSNPAMRKQTLSAQMNISSYE